MVFPLLHQRQRRLTTLKKNARTAQICAGISHNLSVLSSLKMKIERHPEVPALFAGPKDLNGQPVLDSLFEVLRSFSSDGLRMTDRVGGPGVDYC